jgi:AcrR family transcriptional regulator
MRSATGAPAGRREQTKQANRAAILSAGRRVFAEVGYGAATVRDLVRATHLATGTFYNYYPDKEAVFRALVDDFASESRRRARAARARATTFEEFVQDAYRAYFEHVVEDPQMAAVLRRNMGTIRTLFDDTQLPASTAELAEDLRAAVAAGLVEPIDVDYVAHAMVAVAVELGERLLQRHPPDPEGATTFATGLFLGGLKRLAPPTTSVTEPDPGRQERPD